MLLQWSRYDEVLERLLNNMEAEDRLALRLAYVKSLPSLVKVAGLHMCRWSNKFLCICSRYLEVAGWSERGEAPHVLQVTLTICLSSDVFNMILATGSEVCGFKPGRGQWIFSERKNPKYDFLRKGSKAVGCHMTAALCSFEMRDA